MLGSSRSPCVYPACNPVLSCLLPTPSGRSLLSSVVPLCLLPLVSLLFHFAPPSVRRMPPAAHFSLLSPSTYDNLTLRFPPVSSWNGKLTPCNTCLLSGALRANAEAWRSVFPWGPCSQCQPLTGSSSMVCQGCRLQPFSCSLCPEILSYLCHPPRACSKSAIISHADLHGNGTALEPALWA